MEKGMYVYPWEIKDIGDFENEYAETGCNAVAPALSYHHAATFAASTGRCKNLRESAVSFTPGTGRYGKIVPCVNEECARAGTVQKLRSWAKKTDIHFAAWTVLLHNSSQGERHEAFTTENIFGDRYPHALCPSNAEIQEYALSLINDILDQFCPDSLMLESVTTLPAFHGAHHEIANITVTPALRWLYSLCFCPSCRKNAARRYPGIDPDALRSSLKEIALRLAAEDTLIQGNGDAQTMQLLLEIPGLFEYQKAREEGVADFIALATAPARERGVRATVIPSATPFDANHVFMEGMNFLLNRTKADLLLPLVYGQGETYASVKRTVRLFDEKTPVGMAMSLNPAQSPTKTAFLAACNDAKEAGCEHFYFYNFSLASAERRSWVRQVV
ncbi:hypothetical protein HRQ91_03585 [Treponema parvum]|uniref:Uncharacterized protein n=1 Tax=Treponema parvum TaxID=138851 RepID=A0A975F3G2_9SPIR|nr:hypothetical protein [Treponema parvum]QTQ13611.1 hypothetical protein HRQ91_03585 [Treponema parvum]